MATKGRIEQEIVVTVIGGKDIGALEKQIKALEKTKAEVVVGVDTGDAEKEIAKIDKQLAELRGEKAELEITAKVNQAIDAIDTVATEAKQAEAAAEALSRALGPELTGTADMGRIIGGLNRMGLSMQEITDNADKLGAKLREVGQQQVGGIDATFGRLDSSARSASGSASVLANAIGNTTQDIGQMAGLSGTAGVAIGQMGEYMADAALEGENLASVMANFGKIAAPLLVLAAGVGILKTAQELSAKEAAGAAERTKEYADAMKEAGDATAGLSQGLQQNAEDFDAFRGHADDTFHLVLEGVDRILERVPLIGEVFKNIGPEGSNVPELLDRIGTSMNAVAETAEGNIRVNAELEQSWKDAAEQGVISEQELRDLLDWLHDYQGEAKAAKLAQEALNFSAEDYADILQGILNKDKPLEQHTELWEQLMRAINSGDADQVAALTRSLALLLNLPGGGKQALEIALEEINSRQDETQDKLKETSDAFKDNADAAREWARDQQKAANDAAVALGGAQAAVLDLNGIFNTIDRRKGALQGMFDLGDAPIEAFEAMVDLNEEIRDLKEFITKEGVPDIFDPNDVDVQPFLQKIGSMRGPIQSAITDAFASGGPAAAQATADAYVKQIVQSLGGRLDEGQVQTLLGLGDLETMLHIAVDQASLTTATELLNILTGLGGETPWTATVQLALAAGDITPQTAQVLIARQLESLGVEVPTALETPDDASRTAAVAAADRWLADHPTSMQAELDSVDQQSMVNSHDIAQRFANNHPVAFPAVLVPPKNAPWWAGLPGFDAGGTVPGAGGIAGERGPEILNDRFLTTRATVVPPGTKVTSRRRTAVILRQGRGSNLRRYDAGGVVPSGPVTVNFNGVGTIGNRYDLMRTIHRANLDKIRLRGTRG